MNLKQWQRSKEIKAEAEAAAKRTVERVLNAVKEPAMSEFKEFEINDWVKANDGQFGFNELFKIVDFFADRNGTLLAVLDDGDCYPLSCLEHASEAEIKAGHRIDNDMGDDSHIENHISPNCKVEDV